MKSTYLYIFFLLFFFNQSFSQNSACKFRVAAQCIDDYIYLLEGKKIAVVANQASLINNTHLIDFLVAQNLFVTKIFSPEHGFRGNADAGAKVKNSVDKKTGLPVFSLYGKNKKPSVDMLKSVDLVLFDLQDVGVRFYTYISTLHYVMEACAENNIPLIVLDRPNPNAFYIDGPVLDMKYKSFIGMHPVPVVYGMSIGEYALMINGEGWLDRGILCDIKVVEMKNWTHDTLYDLPIKPSPNLPNATSVLLYPSLCFFEGTRVSIGRGTDFPFQCFGHPDFIDLPLRFTPRSIPGASKYPKLLSKLCRGKSLRYNNDFYIVETSKLDLSHLIYAYHNTKHKHKFFTSFFKLLAGNDILRKQIEDDMCENKIRISWQKELNAFKEIRRKYLLYP